MSYKPWILIAVGCAVVAIAAKSAYTDMQPTTLDELNAQTGLVWLRFIAMLGVLLSARKAWTAYKAAKKVTAPVNQ